MHRNTIQTSQLRTPPDAVVHAAQLTGRGLGPLVLMADGDGSSRDIREAQLRSAGLRVLVARTGFEAIVKASCQMPDVILLADSLTGIETDEAIRMLTTCPMTAHIPIVRLLRGRRLPQRVLSRLRRVAA